MKDIVRGLTPRDLKLGVTEPMIEAIKKRNGGRYDPDDLRFSYSPTHGQMGFGGGYGERWTPPQVEEGYRDAAAGLAMHPLP
jgi:hypothetical protein